MQLTPEQRRIILIVVFVVIITIVLTILLYYSNRHAGLLLPLRHDRAWLPNIGESLFSPSEVEELCERMKKLPIRWSNSTLGTIGTASYIDSPETHKREAANNNRLLLRSFPGLHRRLIRHLNRRFQTIHKQSTDAELHRASADNESKNIEPPSTPRWVYPHAKHQIALPGIHIFAGNTLLGQGWAVASVHVDRQEERCPLPETEIFDFSNTYSFTIPLTLPSGTGLYILQARSEEIPPWQPLWWSLRCKIMQKIDYELGHCYLHHGKYFHMIAPFKAKSRDGMHEQRVTIQGHAVYCTSRNEYWVYW